MLRFGVEKCFEAGAALRLLARVELDCTLLCRLCRLCAVVRPHALQ